MLKVAKKGGSFGQGLRKLVHDTKMGYVANPSGLKLLCALLAISSLFFIAFAMLIPELAFRSIIAGTETSAWPTYVIKAISMLLPFTLAIGLSLRKKWAYEASIIVFGAWAINSYMTLAAPRLEAFGLIAEFIMIGSIGAIIVNLASIWYLLEIKSLFRTTAYKERLLVEKVYKTVYVVFGFFFLIMLIGVFFQMAEAFSSSWEEIRCIVKSSPPNTAFEHCGELSSTDAEACRLSAIIYNPKAFYTTDAQKIVLCGNFKGVVYRLACLKVVS